MVIPFGKYKNKELDSLSNSVLTSYMVDGRSTNYPGFYESIVQELSRRVYGEPEVEVTKTFTPEDIELVKRLRRLVIANYHPDINPEGAETLKEYLDFFKKLHKVMGED